LDGIEVYGVVVAPYNFTSSPTAGMLGVRELRTLITRLYDIPTSLEHWQEFESMLLNCSHHQVKSENGMGEKVTRFSGQYDDSSQSYTDGVTAPLYAIYHQLKRCFLPFLSPLWKSLGLGSAPMHKRFG
jgi:hypothetical protein